MLSSSRDNWERLVTAVIRREELWQLFHAPSRSPSISTDSTSHSSRQISTSLSTPPPVPPKMVSLHPGACQRQEKVHGGIKRGGIAARAMIIFAAPRNLLAAWYPKQKGYPSEAYGHLRRFSPGELEVATEKFCDKNIVGEGGFSKVYKGQLADGSLVAIKRLREQVTEQELWLRLYVDASSLVVHPNIIRLLGFCILPAESLLIYPFMLNGSVASCLRDRPESPPPLDWTKRTRIAIGTAGGLAYLHDHSDPKILHLDVQAANILLDDDFNAVLGGFAFAKILNHHDSDVETPVRGTTGHLAPECVYTGRCSEKSDVFSYGIFLLELITGQRALDLTRLATSRNLMLLDLVRGVVKDKNWDILADPNLQGNYMGEEMKKLLRLALLCTRDNPEERPKMSEIVRMLETIDDCIQEETLYQEFIAEAAHWL